VEIFGIKPLLAGAVTTLWLAVLAIVVGTVLGLALGILRWLRLPGLGRMLAIYISVVRATPLLTLALVIFFLVPAATGYDMPATLAAVIAMSVNTSAFNCEIWCAGLEDFPREQLEAARAAGMRRGLLLRRIVLPQVARSNLPPLVNEMTVLIKNSPAISVIGIVDLTRCTPFLLLVYLLYYGLPSFGIRLDNEPAGFVALLLYNTAYIAEILRSGWANRPHEEIEASYAFGFHGFQLIRRLILPPVFYSTAPMLGNQFIQIIKDSSLRSLQFPN
jgi:polar amino acid transport system permease protein